MAYFPDLSPYTYGGTTDSEYLNVGWLGRAHSFEKAPPDPRFVAALMRCAARPDRLFRGMHICELCDEPECPTEVSADDLSVVVGNGEIRVNGSTGRSYAAPTLVAHYVVEHNYSPPTEFVEAIIRRAAEIHILSSDEKEAVQAMAISAQFELLIRIMDAVRGRHPEVCWLEDVVEIMRLLAPSIRSGAAERARLELWVSQEKDGVVLPELWTPVNRALPNFLNSMHRHESAASVLVDLLERADEAGLDVGGLGVER